MHYYFTRKPDLLSALVERLPEERVDRESVIVAGDVTESLCRLVTVLDEMLGASATLSHLLWREADTHPAVRDALHDRFDRLVGVIRDVVLGAREGDPTGVESVALLLAAAVSYRHSVARHADDESAAKGEMTRELRFLAEALDAGVG